MRKAALSALVAVVAVASHAPLEASASSVVLSRVFGDGDGADEAAGLLTANNGNGGGKTKSTSKRTTYAPKPASPPSTPSSSSQPDGGAESETQSETQAKPDAGLGAADKGGLDHVVSLDGHSEHPLPGTEAADELEPAHATMPTRFPPLPPGTLPAAPPTAAEIKAGRKPAYVCLTFDDGPNGATEAVADVVTEVGGHADFYFNCHMSQAQLYSRAQHLVQGGHGIQSHQCDHATVRSPSKSPFKEYEWPSMKNYRAIYGDRKQYTPAAGNCFKGDKSLREALMSNYRDTVRRFVTAFQDNGATLPATDMTLARLPGDGRFYKCLTGAIEGASLEELGHKAVSPHPFHSGWQFEVAPTSVKWGHLKYTGHQGVEGIRASEPNFPGDGDIILMHEAHFRRPESLANLKEWLEKLKAHHYEIGRINPANGRCERWNHGGQGSEASPQATSEPQPDAVSSPVSSAAPSAV